MGVADTSFALADACDALANAITDARNAPHWLETPGQAALLNSKIATLRSQAGTARTTGVAASLESAAPLLTSIGQAAAQAKAAAGLLKQVNAVITLAGSLLSLAAAASVGDISQVERSASAVFAEADALVTGAPPPPLPTSPVAAAAVTVARPQHKAAAQAGRKSGTEK